MHISTALFSAGLATICIAKDVLVSLDRVLDLDESTCSEVDIERPFREAHKLLDTCMLRLGELEDGTIDLDADDEEETRNVRSSFVVKLRLALRNKSFYPGYHPLQYGSLRYTTTHCYSLMEHVKRYPNADLVYTDC